MDGLRRILLIILALTSVSTSNSCRPGKCVPRHICPYNRTEGVCENGFICCSVSARIVTPNNNDGSAAVPPPGTSAQSVGSASPSGTNPPQGTAPAAGPPPNGGSPPAGSPPDVSGNPASGTNPPQGTPSANGGPPPSGSSPPAGPPLVMGNIVAGPEVPPKSLNDNDTIAVSAEVEYLDDRSEAFLDRQCEAYHATVPRSAAITVPGNDVAPPIVMVIGGVDSMDKEFPHMAALGFGDASAIEWLCGGSLVSENFVVTAAHCLISSIGEVQYVKLGTIRLAQNNGHAQLLTVVNRIQHEQYDPKSHYNDIALLQLERNVAITNYVTPICLWSSTDYEDKNLVATGWGKLQSGSQSLVLQKVGLELFTFDECTDAYGGVSKEQLPLGVLSDSQLCAGSRSSNKDTCQGDSGGPLQVRNDRRWYLVGITSIGLGCGSANVPGIYTRIAHYIPWIRKHVWNK